MLGAYITELLPGCCTFAPVEEIKRIVTRRGFCEVLLERYRDAAASGNSKSQREIFDELEEQFEAYYKQGLNWSYRGFVHYHNRHGKTDETGTP